MINLVIIPESFIGGMAAAKRLGNFVHYLKNNPSYNIINIILSPKTNALNNLPHKRIEQVSLHNINPFIQIIRINKLLHNLFNKGSKNIIYYYGYPDIFNYLYLYYAKRLGYKIVFDIVENNFVINKFNSLKTKLRTSTSRLFFKRIDKIADGIIFISSQLEIMIRRTVSSSIPVLLLPITIVKEKFPDPKEIINSKWPIKIFYGGSYGVKDGLIYLLDAFNILANQFDIELILTGKGNSKDEIKTKNHIAGLKNSDKIKLLGYLSDEEYYKVIISANIHCMTRISSEYANHGFPFKLGEMLATGKPVVATRVGDITKYIKEDEAVLIEPDSVESIVNAIRFLITSPEKAKLIGYAGRKCAFFNFDAEIHTDRLCDFMESII